MSDSNAFGFGKLVPGFDFLQSLGKGAAQGMAQMPHLSSWIAPTLNVEDLDKRIDELKAVQFWLDQNGKALAATIQALEVQKMTLATLKGMNFSLGEMADALKLRPQPEAPASESASPPSPSPSPSPAPAASSPPAQAPSAASARKSKPRAQAGASAQPAAQQGVVDPMQWWGALTQQFKEIATTAMQDVAAHAASVTQSVSNTSNAKPSAKPRGKAATNAAAKTAAKTAAKAASSTRGAKTGAARRKSV